MDKKALRAEIRAKKRALTPAQIEQVKPTVAWIKSVASTVPVVAEAEQPAAQTDADGFATVSDKDDVPF